MRAYGSDRLKVAADGTIELSSRLPKQGWNATLARTSTSAEHPGTAVLWDDQSFEVIRVERLETGVRYTLAPWLDRNAMRITETYDEASEGARATAMRDGERRVRSWNLATVLGIFTGHLPGDVQQHLAHEFGTNAPLLTMVSTVPPFVFTGVTLNHFVAARMGDGPAPSDWSLFLAAYLALDSTLRFGQAFLTRRPIGSILGFFAYSIYYALHPSRGSLVPPIENDLKPHYGAIEVSPEVEALDSVHMWESALTLLSTADQEQLRRRYAYDYRRSARWTAGFIALFAALGIFTSVKTLLGFPRVSAISSLALGTILFVEQVLRFMKFPAGPAPSILRFAVRPFVKKLLQK